MLNFYSFVGKYLIYIIAAAFFVVVGAYAQTYIHTCKVCEVVKCPPQTLITYQIHNDKIKATGNAKIGLEQLIKDVDTKVENYKKDTIPKPKRKKRFWDFLKRNREDEN